jgi:DNA-directed RNA polymerase subunit H
LVPKFRILSEKEKEQILDRFSISEEKLPKILTSDPIVKKMQAKHGDVLEIRRASTVAGESIYYRIVTEG